jgi:predicted nucleic acid-binding protein
MDAALLDTDTLNEVLKRKNSNVVRHAADYLSQYGQFAISSITRYELLRGLKEKNATSQLARFQAFCQNSVIYPVIDVVLDRAVDLWVAGRKQGLSPKDADMIIAATALHHGRVLVTGNTAHFALVPGLTINNWRDP